MSAARSRAAHGLAAALLAGGLVAAPATRVAAQAPVEYTASFENRAHHEARISVRFAGLDPAPLEIVMSRSSPGRYALHEFAKNVYEERAVDGRGQELELERVDPHTWRVHGHDGVVVFEYTLFADHADGTYAGIDASHAHLNMPATFAFAPSLAERPVRVRFEIPPGSGWKVATQLPAAGSPSTFTAPDLQYFMDSPTELSDFHEVSWQVGPADRSQTIRLAVHHQGSMAEAERFAAMAERVTAEQAAVFGGYPDFDYGTYTFIADYLPWVFGDGMEHRNSTILTSRRALEGDGAERNLGTLSHEFFHAWNMERIRSAALEPFDFTRANMSAELWFGEGFTSYYDGLTIHRAGLSDLDGWADDLSGLLNATINAPGRAIRGPAEMSRQAPFVDAATSVDATNRGNTFLSYYTYGAALAAGLDLILRTRYDATLDDLMRLMWRRHGAPGVPYTLADIRAALAEVSGDAAFADRFFRESIDAGGLPDYASLLAAAGFVLRPRNPGAGTLGAYFGGDGEPVVAAPVRRGTAAYEAGLEAGDVLLAVDGRPVATADEARAALADRRPGERVALRYRQRGREVEARVALVEDPSLEVVTFEAVGRPVPAGAARLRRDWLSARR